MFHSEKASNVFRPHYSGGIQKRNMHLCLRKIRPGKSHDYRDYIVFEKLRFQNVFRSHENEKLAFSNFSGSKSVFEKHRFRDVLVWTVGLTVEINLRFQVDAA